MKSAIVSWVAWYYDFDQGEVNEQGPTLDMHRHFYQEHEQHLLLSTGAQGDTRSELLYTRLKQEFPERKVQLLYMDLNQDEIFDFQKVRDCSERALHQLQDYDRIDILFSNGTSPMRTVWLALHLEENGYPTHLIQGKERQLAGKGPRFPEIKVDTSIFAHRIRLMSTEPSYTASAKLLQLPSMLKRYEQATNIASVEGITTLIEGESGTGKEHMARYIHTHSSRKHRPLISVNCAALGDHLLESRLFGYRKGSFTGAEEDRAGFFDAADRGTIFLDEIGDISPYMQQALLRVLQEQKITPLGSTQEREIDVRVIAATNRDLWKACEAGRFRWDLYYRLTQTRIQMPAFRELNAEDRLAFIHYFLRKKAQVFQRPQLTLSARAQRILLAHSFPGNIRELENTLTHCYVFSKGEIQADELPIDIHRHADPADLSLETAKLRHILKVYDIMGGNLTHTAKALDIARNTLKKSLPDEIRPQGKGDSEAEE